MGDVPPVDTLQETLPLTGAKRLELWEKIRKGWTARPSDEVQDELQKMREEWDRKLPPLR